MEVMGLLQLITLELITHAIRGLTVPQIVNSRNPRWE